jgi:hypothetical protein
VSDVFTFAPEDVSPDRDAVLALLGIPEGTELSDRIERLYEHAIGVLAVTVAPAGVIAEIPGDAFAAVYRGDGKNAAETPLALIAPRAEHLALFAVTLGEPLSRAVADCFAGADFALGYTLDAMASVAADAAAVLAERRFAHALRGRGWATPDGAVLRYSPGYCGWDITGQRRLFAALQPAPIGLTLTDSCLMQPLKSVSGVLVAGPRAIHRFPPTFEFCARCVDRTCRERLAALAAAAPQ